LLLLYMQTASTVLTATGDSSATVTADQASTFLHTLQQRNQLRPARMTMAVVAQGGDLAVDEAQAENLAVLQVRSPCIHVRTSQHFLFCRCIKKGTMLRMRKWSALAPVPSYD
jgi:hypothetical protein